MTTKLMPAAEAEEITLSGYPCKMTDISIRYMITEVTAARANAICKIK